MSGEITVLIVGGYGTFGGRIVDLSRNEPRLTLLIAGRSLERARMFRAERGESAARLIEMAFDRDGDVDAQIASIRPDILVDASGPFQNYGERRYRVVEACIANRVNYLDLADGTEFVAGVRAFDAAARAAGVFVLSGLSSFPALTAAAVRHLAAGLARVDTIYSGVAPSPHAGIGENVVRAIAGYAGKPIRSRHDGAEATGYPFTEQRRFTIAPPGHLPLRNRLFSLIDVPDTHALSELWPEVRSVWTGAAPVPEIWHRALILCAWLVRLRLLAAVSPLGKVMRFVTKRLIWGEPRGGMFVAIEGADAAGTVSRRSWHLIAEGNDGPGIPAMATAALFAQFLTGRHPATGARAATRELALDDYLKLFAGRAIVTGVRDDAPGPLYVQLLGEAWHRLPAEIRAVHTVNGNLVVAGRASVERGRGFLARLVANVVGFPEASADTPVSVRFDAVNGGETWTRTFGGKTFSSRQFAGRGRSERLLCEAFGPLTFAMALVADQGRLTLVMRRWTAFGVPMPLALAPHSVGYETVEDGRFRFHAEIGLKLIGLIVRYRGWLVPAGPDDEERPHG